MTRRNVQRGRRGTMFEWVNKLKRAKPGPIGIDLGADTIRMSQVRIDGADIALIAAVREDVPSHLRRDVAGRISWFADVYRELLANGGFVGRQVNIAFSAPAMQVLHVRLPKMEESALRQAAIWDARGKLSMDLGRAAVRHVVAGEIFQQGEAHLETILMATPRELVDQWLAVARKARLDVQGMTPDPLAIADCFSRVLRRKADAESTTAFIDIGALSSRVVVTYQRQLLFSRIIAVGSDTLTAAVAAAFNVPVEQARLMRVKRADEISARLQESENASPAGARQNADVATPPKSADGGEGGFALLSAALDAHRKSNASVVAALNDVDAATLQGTNQLCRELELCRQYHEATFPARAIDRMVLVGGEARNRPLCRQLAEHLGLPVQVGDPMARLIRGDGANDLVDELLDRKQPQPGWATTLGLSMGPMNAVVATKAA